MSLTASAGTGTAQERAPAARELWTFRVTVALLGLTTLLDAFLAPQPGTGWTDHLAAGLVPLALLAAAIVFYPRSRAGVRTALGAVLAVLALEAAALGVVAVTRGTARLADWASLLLWPAGLALGYVAAATLWRSRRREGHRYARRVRAALGVVVAAYVAVLPVALALYATHRPRAEVQAVHLGAPHRPVTVTTADGLELAAWYVPSRNGAAVISFPTRIGKIEHARMLVRHGYGVLLLDMRGYEESEGSPNAFGWGATRDIDAAVAWLQRRPDVRQGRIGGIGFSVGGEQMLEAAAGNPGLRAVVSEGAGERSVREALIRGPRGWLAVPTAAVQTAAVSVLSDTLPPPPLEALTARISPRPIFLIHAGRGGGGEELNSEYYRAAKQPKTIWRIPESGHVGGLGARPGEYERRVVGFFDRALRDG
ncbi:MAG: alpha/beta hydrolase [Gaiellaceae bacterium]